MGCDAPKPHSQADYIVENRCTYKDHTFLPAEPVISEGKPINAPAMSWDRWLCPNGQVVVVNQSPAVK
jgi:hypothetical protein